MHAIVEILVLALGGLLCWTVNRLLKVRRIREGVVLEATITSTEPVDRPAIGDIGAAACDLKLYGQVEIHGERLEARSVSGFVSQGARVRVVEIERDCVVVEQCPALAHTP